MTAILARAAAAQSPAAGAAAAQGRSIGLARVSTRHQSLDAQVAQLEAAGCERVFAERISTRVAEADRPQLQACLAELQAGDELVVVKLDRLGRTQAEVIARLASLQQQGIHVRTLDGLISTKALGSMAPVVVGLLTGLAQMERELIAERTRASVEHRRATGGDLGGRPVSYSPEQVEQVQRLVAEGMSIAAAARATGLTETTARRLAKG
jgi:DNA invertase Pin-like site-specific DNA recombinase